MIFVAGAMPKKRRLGSQNGSGSSGPEKELKIVSCAKTKKLKETMVGPKWNRRVTTNIHRDQLRPLLCEGNHFRVKA